MGCKQPRKKWIGARIKIEEPVTLQKLVDDYLNTPYDCGYLKLGVIKL